MELDHTARQAIDKLARYAGQRAAARALLAGGTDTQVVNRIELTRRQAVHKRLTAQFQSGKLPPELAQPANLPNIEQVGGRDKPPIIVA